jgi:hypothetical protein
VDQEEQAGRSNQELTKLAVGRGRGAAAPFFLSAIASCESAGAGFVAELA